MPKHPRGGPTQQIARWTQRGSVCYATCGQTTLALYEGQLGDGVPLMARWTEAGDGSSALTSFSLCNQVDTTLWNAWQRRKRLRFEPQVTTFVFQQEDEQGKGFVGKDTTCSLQFLPAPKQRPPRPVASKKRKGKGIIRSKRERGVTIRQGLLGKHGC